MTSKSVWQVYSNLSPLRLHAHFFLLLRTELRRKYFFKYMTMWFIPGVWRFAKTCWIKSIGFPPWLERKSPELNMLKDPWPMKLKPSIMGGPSNRPIPSVMTISVLLYSGRFTIACLSSGLSSAIRNMPNIEQLARQTSMRRLSCISGLTSTNLYFARWTEKRKFVTACIEMAIAVALKIARSLFLEGWRTFLKFACGPYRVPCHQSANF